MLDRFLVLRFIQLEQIVLKVKTFFISCIAYKTNAIIIIISAAKPPSSVAQGVSLLTYIL
jgi:hypothetical protein